MKKLLYSFKRKNKRSFLFNFLSVAVFLLFFTGINFSQSIPPCELPQFDNISIDPDLNLNGEGQNVDTIEFWKAPDSSETLMFVSAKGNHLVEVWQYPFEGNELTPLTHSTFESGQVNGLVVDQETDLLYVSIGDPSSTVSVFSLPDLQYQFSFNRSGANYHSEPNLALLNLTNGDKRVYVSMDFDVDIHDANDGSYISSFTPEEGLETMAGDDYYQRIYIPDENGGSGIYVYNPDGTPYTENGDNVFGGGGIFNADAEGVLLYNCPVANNEDNGEGFIVCSDQRSSLTDFEFFDRVTWDHLGAMNVTGVSNTDGIASFPYPLPDYPLGVFAALDNDGSVAVVGWQKIFDEIFSTVPVELTSFNANVSGNNVELKWTTGSETNNQGFEIQRSINNSEFKTVTYIEGKGNSKNINTYNYTDENVDPGIYYYRIKQIDYDGSFEFSNTVEVEVNKPEEFNLNQNYPNPFNPSTIIKYQIPESGKVKLTVFNILGNKVQDLVDEYKEAGSYRVNFNAKGLTAGVYFYTLTTTQNTQTRKMILLK